MSPLLRIAVQKKGRLADASLDVLERAGLGIAPAPGALTCRARGLAVELLFVRDDDIAALVARGACDLGIIGDNTLREEALAAPAATPLRTVRELGFSRCTLKLAAPATGGIKNVQDLQGKRIATSYPAITADFLRTHSIDAQCVTLKGAVEIAPALDLADAICDLVSTGATLAANGLAAFATVMQSQALLVRAPAPWDAPKEALLARLLRRMDGVLASRATKYIMLNAPRDAIDDITALLPGAEAPTLMPLAGRDDQMAVHAVCRETIFWDTLEALEARGAHAILVLPIEKMMG